MFNGNVSGWMGSQQGIMYREYTVHNSTLLITLHATSYYIMHSTSFYIMDRFNAIAVVYCIIVYYLRGQTLTVNAS